MHLFEIRRYTCFEIQVLHYLFEILFDLRKIPCVCTVMIVRSKLYMICKRVCNFMCVQFRHRICVRWNNNHHVTFVSAKYIVCSYRYIICKNAFVYIFRFVYTVEIAIVRKFVKRVFVTENKCLHGSGEFLHKACASRVKLSKKNRIRACLPHVSPMRT